MSENVELFNGTKALIRTLPSDRPILIAGATASGKSALAMGIAEAQGGVIVNADALQVFGNWRILTARPSEDDETAHPHRLYGHIPGDKPYSAGQWLREVKPLLTGGVRPIIVGGTGLNFSALTEGLAEIPPTPPEIRTHGDALTLEELLAGLDRRTADRIDQRNRARVQRAWEVLRATGRPLADWQDDTGPPLLPLQDAHPILIDADKTWLNARIEQRFDAMLKSGALHEAEQNRATFDPGLPSSKAIGAAELINHLEGRLSLEQAREAAVTATRQYAKRQRTWFRSRMSSWHIVSATAMTS
ncbi:MAG: tRNA (adenosine(37)-N6)-dimethylallyltransferase MiaA [Pseudomonadota bacterium]